MMDEEALAELATLTWDELNAAKEVHSLFPSIREVLQHAIEHLTTFDALLSVAQHPSFDTDLTGRFADHLLAVEAARKVLEDEIETLDCLEEDVRALVEEAMRREVS